MSRIQVVDTLDREIARKCIEDQSFRAELVKDPKGAVEGWIRRPLPSGSKVQVIEAEPETLYLIIPSPKATEAFVKGSNRDLKEPAKDPCCRNVTVQTCCTTYSTFSNM
jgi:hypothetical protein